MKYIKMILFALAVPTFILLVIAWCLVPLLLLQYIDIGWALVFQLFWYSFPVGLIIYHSVEI